MNEIPLPIEAVEFKAPQQPLPKEPKIKIPKVPREQSWLIRRDMPRMPRDGKIQKPKGGS
jgi:hypothetical protein